MPFLPADSVGPLLIAFLLFFTVASATQDIAIDAWAVDSASGRNIGMMNGLRASAFRVAVIAAGGLALFIADRAGWTAAWIVVAFLFAALAASVLFLPEPVRTAAAEVERRSTKALVRSFLAWLLRREMLPVVLFALLFKLGDQAISRMTETFWVDRGRSLTEIALVANTIGLCLTIAGALLGGAFLTRVGLYAGLFFSAPVLLGQIWGFVRPGLYPAERKMAAPFIGAGTACFLGGAAFAYLVVLPPAFRFLLEPEEIRAHQVNLDVAKGTVADAGRLFRAGDLDGALQLLADDLRAELVALGAEMTIPQTIDLLGYTGEGLLPSPFLLIDGAPLVGAHRVRKAINTHFGQTILHRAVDDAHRATDCFLIRNAGRLGEFVKQRLLLGLDLGKFLGLLGRFFCFGKRELLHYVLCCREHICGFV